MKEILITILRNKTTNTAEFRRAANKTTDFLAQETFQYLRTRESKIKTYISETNGRILGKNIVLLPILRAGLAFLPIFLSYFENARVGFIGLKRDERTAIARKYYQNIPEVKENDLVVILDPMIATGGTAVETVKSLVKEGVRQNQIIFSALLVAPEGIEFLKNEFPDIKVIFMVKDKGLNKDKFIIPGFGDFGDRYFGTEENT